MRKSLIYISIFATFLFLEACKDYLQLEPFDKVSADVLFSDMSGVKTVLATIYNAMPMEDFNYRPAGGFNQHPGPGGAGDGGWSLSSNTDEAVIYGPNGYTSKPGDALADYWDYTGIRQVNKFLETIQALKTKGTLTEDVYNHLSGDAHFIRGYMYFQLARRKGGVPIIENVQQITEDNSGLFVPRSTEKETWDFVMSELDLAIENLPPALTADDGIYRATKWAALALKSRAALHAASVAKYWNKAPLTGEAVDAGLVGGMTLTDANNYYLQAITASKDIIDNSGKTLYKPDPASREEAAKNYQDMFESPSLSNPEIIFLKAYIDGASTGQQGHITDFWFYPQQTKIQNLYMAARWGTTLDIVDDFEDYTDDGTGKSVPVATRSDGIEDDYVADPKNLTTMTKPYILYDNQSEIFADKDVRLGASVLLPGSTFKGVLINMQGGMVTSTGTPVIYTENSAVGLDGNTYYTYGSNNSGGYSAFGALGTAAANYSSTGFALRKFLQESKAPSSLGPYGSSQSWIDMRLAEVYLNYAEAVIESGQGDAALAAKYLNDIRHRAKHTDNIPATIDNILKERRVELIFEGQRYWDLIRRRDFHTRFSTTRRHSLIPVLDLRQNPPKYLFVRAYNYFDQVATGITFNQRTYYQSISGISSNMLIQNPEY